MEVVEVTEANKIKTLERITISGLQVTKQEQKKDNNISVVNVVLYNGDYYCIDDPLILEGKEKVKVRVIAEVNNLNGVYAEYIRNNTRNTLNPYQLLLLYKKNPDIELPEEIKKILTRNLPIDDEILIMLNEHLLEVERDKRNNGKPIFISLTILDAISSILPYIEKGLQKEELLRIMNKLLEDYEEKQYLQFPSPVLLQSIIEAMYFEQQEEKRRREEEKYIKELKKQKMQNTKADFLIVEGKEEAKTRLIEFIEKEEETTKEGEETTEVIPVTVLEGEGGRRETRSIAVELPYAGREEGRGKEETVTTTTITTGQEMKEILLVFRLRIPLGEEIDRKIQKAITRFINELERLGIAVRQKTTKQQENNE